MVSVMPFEGGFRPFVAAGGGGGTSLQRAASSVGTTTKPASSEHLFVKQQVHQGRSQQQQVVPRHYLHRHGRILQQQQHYSYSSSSSGNSSAGAHSSGSNSSTSPSSSPMTSLAATAHARSQSMPESAHAAQQQKVAPAGANNAPSGAHLHPGYSEEKRQHVRQVFNHPPAQVAHLGASGAASSLRRSQTNAADFSAIRTRSRFQHHHLPPLQPYLQPPSAECQLHPHQQYYPATAAGAPGRLPPSSLLSHHFHPHFGSAQYLHHHWEEQMPARSRNNIAAFCPPPPLAPPPAPPSAAAPPLYHHPPPPPPPGGLGPSKFFHQHHRSLGYLGSIPEPALGASLPVTTSRSCRDVSKPLHVDCSVEYDLGKQPKIPKGSAPLLIIDPAYQLQQQKEKEAAAAAARFHPYSSPVPSSPISMEGVAATSTPTHSRQQEHSRQQQQAVFRSGIRPNQSSFLSGITQSAPSKASRQLARHSSFVVTTNHQQQQQQQPLNAWRLFPTRERLSSRVTVNGVSVQGAEADDEDEEDDYDEEISSIWRQQQQQQRQQQLDRQQQQQHARFNPVEVVIGGGGRTQQRSHQYHHHHHHHQETSDFQHRRSLQLHLSLPDIARAEIASPDYDEDEYEVAMRQQQQVEAQQQRQQQQQLHKKNKKAASKVSKARRSLGARLESVVVSRKPSSDSGASSSEWPAASVVGVSGGGHAHSSSYLASRPSTLTCDSGLGTPTSSSMECDNAGGGEVGSPQSTSSRWSRINQHFQPSSSSSSLSSSSQHQQFSSRILSIFNVCLPRSS